MQIFFKKIFGSGFRLSDLVLRNTTLIMYNEEMNDIIKIIKSFEESSLLIKGISQIIRNKASKQQRGFLSMLF